MPHRAALDHPTDSGAVSWFDLYPPTSTPSDSIPDTRKPTPCPKTIARINKIHEVLAEVMTTMDNRKHLLRLYKHDGRYCADCTPRDVIGACGRTCPLLRPEDREDNPPITRGWVQSASADCVAYKEILDDMDARGYEVYPATVGRWERAAERLRLSGLTEAERHADMNWTQVPRVNDQAGFKACWTFGEHWGNGPGFCEETAPEDPREDSKRSLIVGEEYVSKRFKRALR